MLLKGLRSSFKIVLGHCLGAFIYGHLSFYRRFWLWYEPLKIIENSNHRNEVLRCALGILWSAWDLCKIIYSLLLVGHFVMMEFESFQHFSRISSSSKSCLELLLWWSCCLFLSLGKQHCNCRSPLGEPRSLCVSYGLCRCPSVLLKS